MPNFITGENPAPKYLLIPAAFSADYLFTLEEFSSLGLSSKIYGPELVEAEQSFWCTVIVFDCCMVVCPVPVLASWSAGFVWFTTVDAKTGFLILHYSAILRSIFTLKTEVEGVEIF